MATNKSNVGFKATLGQVAKNVPGTHGGISPAGGKLDAMKGTASDSGNPGTEVPWQGSDATDIGSTTALPPLKSL